MMENVEDAMEDIQKDIQEVSGDTAISSANVSCETSGVVAEATHGIEEQRAVIDEVDEQIIRLLARRFTATRQVGLLKAKAGFAALDSVREEHQLERMTVLARECGLEEEIAHAYRDFVVTESKKRHRKIAEEHST
ncbi:chorismate mutase [Alloscardovia venturai]|uniref:Chorismate mutase n=1 Tax=Alloscardovia venturai TaxID=1769421 RepID=A0ABW2Y2F1_9BIFI